MMVNQAGFREDVPVRYNDHPSLGEKLFGHLFSVILHPVFVPVYVIAFLIYLHPHAFTGFSAESKFKTLIIIAVNLVFFPLLSVLLLRAVGFISSIHLITRKDRIIPYIAVGIFYFWAYTVFRGQPQYPDLLVFFLLGIFLASSAGLIANIYFKISMHALGMGGMIGFFLVLFSTQSILMGWPLALSVLLTGSVCTARLMVSTHEPRDLYMGLLLGMLSQFVAAIYIL